ncbi:MAG: DUF1439 domain-containing protein [Rhodoferax sp.]|nr:DUF1439 domain-containing protein [Rhodoferax sp.]MDD5334716.1 DUF1439 domain-containing protein [Rhodoferax sp.]
MDRRFLLTAVAGLTLAGVALAALPPPQPAYSVSAEQLERVVAQRFPLRYPVPGLFDLELQAPRLHLLPEQNRLSAQMTVEAAGAALRRRHSGSFDVDFALRYEASDRTIRACQLRFRHLRFADLQPAASELLNVYGPALARQSLLEVVLYQLRSQDLALADGLGLQPGSITVTEDGLTIGFVPKPL